MEQAVLTTGAALSRGYVGIPELGGRIMEVVERFPPPTYRDHIRPFLRSRNLEIHNGRPLLGNGAFVEHLIQQMDVSGRLVLSRFGSMFSWNPQHGGGFRLLVCNGDRPETFHERASRFEATHPGSHMVLQVAAAFSCNNANRECDFSTPSNWDPDGMILLDGESRGWREPNKKFGGMVVLWPDRPPAIASLENRQPDLASASLFQTFRLVINGKTQSDKFKSPDREPRRALVERDFIDLKGTEQRDWSIVEIEQSLTLAEMCDFLLGFGVRNAALLNTGSHGLGEVRYNGGIARQLLTPHDKEPPLPNFTTILAAIAPRVGR